jgi:hypothetical protein
MVMCASTPRFVLHVHAPLPGVACHKQGPDAGTWGGGGFGRLMLLACL